MPPVYPQSAPTNTVFGRHTTIRMWPEESEPGAPVAMGLPEGISVRVLRRRGDMVLVETSACTQGWIDTTLVSETECPRAPAVERCGSDGS